MVSPSNSETSGYSRTEWGSLPIQERIRAMAEASPVRKISESETEEISVNSHNAATKRSSVVDMWRKREVSANSSSAGHSSAAMNSVETDSPRKFDHLEEKKEPTPDEDVEEVSTNEPANNNNGPLSPPLQGHPSPSPRTSTVRPAIVSPSTPIGKSSANNSWRQRDSSYTSFAKNPTVTPSSDVSPVYHKTGSPAPWQTKSPAAKLEAASVTPVQPFTPDNAEKPAFSDLKSKWAQFGAQKIQKRENAKILPAKARGIANSTTQRNNKVDDECSIDGDIRQPRDFAAQGKAELLQQPVLDVSDDRSQEVGNGKPTPSKKVGTYMYVKDGTKAATDQEIQDGSPSRLNPRQLAQRKHLLDKHRRRKKVLAGSSSTENSPTSATSDDDAFNTAFEAAGTNIQSQKSTTNMSTAAMETPSQQLFTGSNIPMKTLMAYGADEDEFISTEFGPGQIPVDVGYKSLLVSASQSLKDSKLEEQKNRESPPVTNTNMGDYDSGVGSLPSKSSIADRAQKSMRDKRTRARGTGSVSEPPGRHARDERKPDPSYDEDEMMILEKEQGTPAHLRVTRVVRRPQQSSDDLDAYPQNQACDDSASVRSMSTISNMLSTITSFSETTSHKGQHRAPKRRIAVEAIVADEFVTESNANVDAFASTFQALSLDQIAKDLREEASSVFEGVNFKKFSSDLNEGVAAAQKSWNASISKMVGREVFKRKAVALRRGAASPVEEIAIEVEYVEDPE